MKNNTKCDIFTDYRNKFSRLKPFFGASPYTPASYAEIIHTIQQRTYARAMVRETLREINQKLNASRKTMDNIELFSRTNTCTIITGHQPVIFGGPLFILYKALSAFFGVMFSTSGPGGCRMTPFRSPISEFSWMAGMPQS